MTTDWFDRFCAMDDAQYKADTEKQELIDAVIAEMKAQIADNDWTVIEELLRLVSNKHLKGFLPEEETTP
jgi:hypothetical protein